MGGEEIRVAMWSSWAGVRVCLRFTSVTLKRDWSAQVCAFPQRDPPPAQENTDTHTQPQRRVGRQLGCSGSSIMGPFNKNSQGVEAVGRRGFSIMEPKGKNNDSRGSDWSIQDQWVRSWKEPSTCWNLSLSVRDVSWKEWWSAIWVKFQEAHRLSVTLRSRVTVEAVTSGGVKWLPDVLLKLLKTLAPVLLAYMLS